LITAQAQNLLATNRALCSNLNITSKNRNIVSKKEADIAVAIRQNGCWRPLDLIPPKTHVPVAKTSLALSIKLSLS